MRFKIVHEIKGRIRIHMMQRTMTDKQADILQYYLESCPMVGKAKVYERTQDAVICFSGDKNQMIHILQKFTYENVSVPDSVLELSSRKMNREYMDKLVTKVVMRMGRKLVLPYYLRCVVITVRSIKYIWKGFTSVMKGKIEVALLDGVAIGVSVLRRDMNTASSVMFLLGVGELLEEWTHKKSVDDLARSMSLNVSKVWLLADEKEILVDTKQVKTGDLIVAHMGNVIPFDGIVEHGEGMVNQSSLTGESVPIEKKEGSYVYAGTVLEEGELTIQVKETLGSTKYEKIVGMIEETEKLKSAVECRAEHLADRLVPYTLLGTGLVYLFTRNTSKALSVLMVDFSCALKLAMPITVLAAIREASRHHITVKGGKFLEQVAQADTIIFDKTGTLTKAQPTVEKVVSFNGEDPDELLRIAACLEEHFPHSMAKAVVNAAKEKGLIHEENHSKVEYIVAHGISSRVEDKKVIIGSYHFVFEDEECHVPEEMEEAFRNLPEEYSRLYLAIEGELAAAICIADPVREEAEDVIAKLKDSGISKVVMMTGDSERTAAAVAKRIGIDEYYSEVLPEDKAAFVEKEHAEGRKVIMIGDGVNDSPALSAADVGIAISDGAQIAREVADITIEADNLNELVRLRMISKSMVKKIRKNYVRIVGINSGLIFFGVTGTIQPTTSALLHNTSTLAISMDGMNGWHNVKGN
ncbi:MAG: heavy metal translocating P-type ATPase [Lachnospiraceae bacterium]|nr:heavy metal translocating P-type ATPase [Lachnospiraceae bacterium]